MKCPNCGKIGEPEKINYLIDIGVYTEWRCLRCHMVLRKKWDNPSVKVRRWYSVKELLLNKNRQK